MDEKQTDSPPEKPLFTVTLTAYDWHVLMNELEHSLRVVNRDSRNLVKIYEAVAAQLAGAPVKVLKN